MREKLEAKTEEVLDYIMSKDASQISYNEYRIMDTKLMNLKYDEAQKERDKKMVELVSTTFSGVGVGPTPLPEEVKEG